MILIGEVLMKRSLFLAAGLLAAAGAVAPASAETVNTIMFFENVCAQRTATFRVCASAEVFITEGNVLNFKVWNMNGYVADGDAGAYSPASTAAAYADQYGGWHTITSVGISNLAYTLGGGENLTSAVYHSQTDRTLTRWESATGANSLQVAHTGTSTDGHHEGIVGCFDPDRNGKQQHVETCDSYPGESYVLFQIRGFQTITLDHARFEFHSQQVASDKCKFDKWDEEKCTSESLKGSSVATRITTTIIEVPPTDEPPRDDPPTDDPPRDDPPTVVVPEPMTMILLGSGLLGLGAARARRRREDGTEEG
jgi:hypothetical protein